MNDAVTDDNGLAEAADRLCIEPEVLRRIVGEVRVAWGVVPDLAAPADPEPHLFIAVLHKRVGAAGVPWAFLGSSTGRPWDQDLGPRARAHKRVAQALKSFGRGAFVKLPVQMCPGRSEDGLKAVEGLWIGSVGVKGDARLFNDISVKDQNDVSDNPPAPPAQPPSSPPVAPARPDEVSLPGGNEAPQTPATPVPNGGGAGEVNGFSALHEEAVKVGDGVASDAEAEAAAPDAGGAESEGEAGKLGKTRANGSKPPREKKPRAPRVKGQELTPRVKKWVETKHAEAKQACPDLVFPLQYGIAKKWHDLVKEHGGKPPAEAAFRKWLHEKKLAQPAA